MSSPRPEFASAHEQAKETLHANKFAISPSSYAQDVTVSFLRKLLPTIPAYTRNTIYASVCGFLFGFDTSSIGPITVMPQFEEIFAPISPTLHGLIVSCILLTAAVSSFAGVSLSDRISRTYTIAVGCFLFGIGSLLCAATNNSLVQFLMGRCIAGLGEGLFISATTVYICEIAPAHVRGRLTCVNQLISVVGLATGYFFCYGTVQIQSSFSWRLPFVLQTALSFILAASVPFLPHSPRWLKHVGRSEEADQNWAKLGFSTAEVEKEEEQMDRGVDTGAGGSVAAASAPAQKEPWYQVARDLCARDIRLRTFLGCLLMGMAQASGIDGVLYYAPVLFAQAGLTDNMASFMASGVSGLLIVIFTVIGLFSTDKWRRRAIVLWGGAFFSFTMLAIGTLYASGATDHSAGRWAVIVLIYLFVMSFAGTWGVVVRLYTSEIHPMKTRAAATNIGQCASATINWLIAFTMPMFLAKSSSGPYFMFGGCTLLTVLICAALMPESRGLTLNGLDEAFKSLPWHKGASRFRRRFANTRESSNEDAGIELRSVLVLEGNM